MARRSFTGRTVLVTGAGGGLGRSIALRFAAAGSPIVALDKDATGVEGLAAEITGRGGRCLAVPCDVTDAAACASACGENTGGGVSSAPRRSITARIGRSCSQSAKYWRNVMRKVSGVVCSQLPGCG